MQTKVRCDGVLILKKKEALKNLNTVFIYTTNAVVTAIHIYRSIPLTRKEYLFFFLIRKMLIPGI